ncbi:glycosyltransferase family 4 protein [Candidatus Saccharibacteria bacterium]|nr:glycosyltransferase family 4 protein [Candidatus Saccharibacteria bacterium]
MIIGYVLDDTLDRSDGVQQAMLAIGEKMRSLGHEVHYIVPYTERTDIQNIHSVAKVIALKFNGNSIRTPIWSSKKKLKQLLRNTNFDVLHVQMPYSPFMAARVVRLAPKTTKIVGTFHILPYNWMSKYGTKVLGWVLTRNKKRFTTAFAVSKPAVEFMKDDFGLSGSVLGNPIDYDFFHRYASESKDVKIKRIVFVGRFEERKGVRQLVKAYEQMSIRGSVELVMCGKGPLHDEIASYAQSRGLNVLLPGFVTEEEKAKYLASADVAIFPSTSGESFGIVLTEAMSAGAGVTLGGNNPGYASVLADWPDALFDPNDIPSFTAILEMFVEDETKQHQLGARQHEAVKQYDIGLIAERLLSEAY